MSEVIGRREFFGKALSKVLPERQLNPFEPSDAPLMAKEPRESLADWVGRLRAFITAAPASNLVLVLPEYRPDLIAYVANSLGYRAYDYRAEVMAPRSWQAHKLELREMLDTLLAEGEADEIIAYNVEALLSTRAVNLRQEWYSEYFTRPSRKRLIIVMTLYGDELADGHPAVLRFERGEVPESTLLRRMLEVKGSGNSKSHPVTVIKD